MVAAGLLAMLGASTARATDMFANWHTIPRSVQAVDFQTGAPFQMPAVPYGHYAKSPFGGVAKAAGLAASPFHKAAAAAHMLCAKCMGKGCGLCGGLGMIGNGCGDPGCNICVGHGGICKTSGYGDPSCGLLGKHGLLPCKESQAFVGFGGLPVASPQQYCSSPQGAGLCGPYAGKCGPGLSCFGKGGFGGIGCGGGDPGGMVQPCMGCGGKGCGLCGGKGLNCLNCGGKGCGLCMDMIAKCKAALCAPGAMVAKALHCRDVKYFVGAGGPVPLTPGYVPYVVPTRSPRDYFAFPPIGAGVQPDY
jgi:hypothetical protein